jgi:coenzyme F420-0:L-glutamate ligase/coenzyme F420-1:gamma-L-glutamate ligase
LSKRFGAEIGVVITDTFRRPWRQGQVNVASGLVVGKAARTPVVLFRGLDWQKSNHKAADILRPSKENMF